MNFKHILAALLLFLSLLDFAHAAGEPVGEDLSKFIALSEFMIQSCKQRDSEGFMESVNFALQLTAENRNNSLILPRASAMFRAAKDAVKAGKFAEGIEAVELAQTILKRKKVLKWDGGS